MHQDSVVKLKEQTTTGPQKGEWGKKRGKIELERSLDG